MVWGNSANILHLILCIFVGILSFLFRLYRMDSLSFGRWGNFTMYPGANNGSMKKGVSGPLSESVGISPERYCLGWRWARLRIFCYAGVNLVEVAQIADIFLVNVLVRLCVIKQLYFFSLFISGNWFILHILQRYRLYRRGVALNVGTVSVCVFSALSSGEWNPAVWDIPLTLQQPATQPLPYPKLH